MASPEKGIQTQLKNIQTKTDKTLEELAALIKKRGLVKHGETRSLLVMEPGPGHGGDQPIWRN